MNTNFLPDYLINLEWRPATYNYQPLENWYISENGILFNDVDGKIKYGHDNVKGKDFHLRVSIKHKLYYVSKIVAEAFVKNDKPEVNTVVRHLNDDPHDTHYSNLMWGTSQENTYDGILNGKIKYDADRIYTSGENHPQSLLTEKQVRKICIMLQAGESVSKIAKVFDVAPGVVYHIYNGKSWRRVIEQYMPFPKISAYNPPSFEVKYKIMVDLLKEPELTAKFLCEKYNLECSNSIKGFINQAKLKINKNVQRLGKIHLDE